MKRVLFLAAAATFFAWENVAAAQWLAAHGGLAAGLTHAWRALWTDRLVLLILTDMGVFSLAALVWFVRDMRQQGLTRTRRAAWLAGTIILGCPAFLTYLAFRSSLRHRGQQLQAGAPTP